MGEHLIDGEFQSDKYPTTPRGKVPLSCKDPTAQDLLWEYAQRRRSVDAEFSDDLEAALKIAGYTAPPQPSGPSIEEQIAAARRVVALGIHALEDHRQRRLLAGHTDIGAGTDHLGLWDSEVADIAIADAFISSYEAQSRELVETRAEIERLTAERDRCRDAKAAEVLRNDELIAELARLRAPSGKDAMER